MEAAVRIQTQAALGVYGNYDRLFFGLFPEQYKKGNCVEVRYLKHWA